MVIITPPRASPSPEPLDCHYSEIGYPYKHYSRYCRKPNQHVLHRQHDRQHRLCRRYCLGTCRLRLSQMSSPPKSPGQGQWPMSSPPKSQGQDQSPMSSPPKSPGQDQSPMSSPPKSPGQGQSPMSSPPKSPGQDQSPMSSPPKSPGQDQSPGRPSISPQLVMRSSTQQTCSQQAVCSPTQTMGSSSQPTSSQQPAGSPTQATRPSRSRSRNQSQRSPTTTSPWRDRSKLRRSPTPQSSRSAQSVHLPLPAVRSPRQMMQSSTQPTGYPLPQSLIRQMLLIIFPPTCLCRTSRLPSRWRNWILRYYIYIYISNTYGLNKQQAHQHRRPNQCYQSYDNYDNNHRDRDI